MAIKQNSGDLLAQRGILVHGCNCMGVMGAGVADLIRRKYPAAYKAYKRRYDIFGLQLGDIIAVANPELRKHFPDAVRHVSVFDDSIPQDVIVVNAMTQYDYGNDPAVLYADYNAIEAAYARIRMLARAVNMPVHFPAIGCGLANGKWGEVSQRIERGLAGQEGNLWLLPGTSLPK